MTPHLFIPVSGISIAALLLCGSCSEKRPARDPHDYDWEDDQSDYGQADPTWTLEAEDSDESDDPHDYDWEDDWDDLESAEEGHWASEDWSGPPTNHCTVMYKVGFVSYSTEVNGNESWSRQHLSRATLEDDLVSLGIIPIGRINESEATLIGMPNLSLTAIENNSTQLKVGMYNVTFVGNDCVGWQLYLGAIHLAYHLRDQAVRQ